MNYFNLLSDRKLKYFFISILFIFFVLLTLGLPVVSWLEFIVVCITIIIIITNKLIFSLKKLIIAFLITLISIILGLSFSKKIEEGFFIYPTESNVFVENNLPREVNLFLINTIENNYDANIPSLVNNWSFSADGFWQKKTMSRLTNDINFDSVNDLRIGAFNDVHMQINLKKMEHISSSVEVNNDDWGPYSLRLPLVLKYVLPNKFSNAELCYEGLIYINKEFLNNDEYNCIKLNKESLEILAFDLDPLPNLKMKLVSDNIFFQFNKILKYIQVFLALTIVFMFGTISITSILYLFFSMMNYFIYLFDIVVNENLPSRFSPFIYMARGNDGLIHYGYGREILHHFSEGNLLMAFRGGADVFHFMPGLRYFHSFWMIFFGETILGYVLIGILMPFLIYNLFKKFFPTTISKVLVWFFLFIPILESFGFIHFYYMKLIAKGFGGTLGWISLFAAILLFLNKKEISLGKNFLKGFLASVLLVIAISCRPNILPTAIVLVIGFGFLFLIYNNIPKVIGIILGFANLFWISFHNIYFGGEFFLITNSATIERNMPVTPEIWITFFSSIIYGKFNYELFNIVLTHMLIWIDYYQIWLMLCIIILILLLFIKKIDYEYKIITLSLLIGHSVFVFYEGVPRYAYGLWFLSFIMMLAFIKEKTYIPLLLTKLYLDIKNKILS